MLFLAATATAVFACADSNIPQNPYGEAWSCKPFQGKWVCDNAKNGRPNVYSQNLTADQKRSATSRALGWMPDNSDTVHPNVCGGHYYQPDYPNLSSEKSLSDSVSQVLSNKKEYTLGGKVNLTGNVEIVQPGRRMYADHVVLYPTPGHPSKPQRILAEGHVRLRQPGQMILGKTLKANLYTHKATLTDAYYLMRVKSDWSSPDSEQEDENFTGFAHGHADTIKQNSKTNYVFHDATYTTCPPGVNTWKLDSSKIVLDKISGRGVAENSVLHIQGLPVFYFPYFSFPLTNKRQTGFLYGTIGSSSSNGMTFTMPYYMNLAPNYDDTLTPIFYLKRGVMIDNQFRYLTPKTAGVLNTTLLPDDRESHRDRWFVNYLQNTQFNPNWSANFLYNDVSDPNYFNDFENNNAQQANQTTLARHVNIAYAGTNWDFSGFLRSYKVINQDLALGNRPYNTLPELDLDANYPNSFGPFQLAWNSQLVNFQKNALAGSVTGPLEAQRLHIQPSVSLPLVKSYGFFTPAVALDATKYQLQNAQENSFPDTSITRALPIFDVDTGLLFTRQFSLLGSSYTQTLEPRLYYLYKPYRNQNNIPVFDSSVIQFGYGSLFSTRRFNGLDRFGDANHLAYALSTSVDDTTGRQVFGASLGQIYYFQTRRVSLCRTAGCIASENPDFENKTSDVAGNLSAAITQHLNFNMNFSFNPDTRLLDTQNYSLQYIPDPKNIFNIGFSSNRTDFSLLSNQELLDGVPPPMLAQVTSSFLWKFSPTWHLLGSLNYSTNQSRVVDTFAGFEYSPCSWAVRFIWRRYLLNDNPNDPNSLDGNPTSSFAIQFQLKGLGNLGSSNIQYLASEIPGYSPIKSGF